MFEDELKLYRGRDIKIKDKIVVIQPTLSQIEEFGEREYFNAVHTLTAVGADFKWQLWDYDGIDYTTIEDYDLFIKYIYPSLSSRKRVYYELTNNPEKYKDELAKLSEEELSKMLINPLSLILKDLDFADFIPMNLKLAEGKSEIVLYNPDEDLTIDRIAYSQIVDIVRKIHGYKRNNQIPANERTKMDLIEDARDEAMANANKPYKSILQSMVSTMKLKCGQYGNDSIWDSKIHAFFYDIKRLLKIQDSELLLQGAYSGFASLKGVDKSRLDIFGDI